MNNIKTLWDKFNDWIDPKFGIHIVWVIPVFLLIALFDFLADKLHNSFNRVKNLFQKRDIKDLKKLSGMK
jgi:hypothetical protein